ncbi:MAG: prepilin-type N-terminal cleavage/methylation domain-containing protein, partial [Acidimicrobiia bacterium]
MTRPRDDRAFTLVELMVVVLVIAILLSIAVPTFLGARGRAQDSSAKSSLRSAAEVAMSASTGTDLSALDAATLAVDEPGLVFVSSPSPSTGPKVISVSASTTGWAAAAMSASGRCFGVTVTSRGMSDLTALSGGACTGAAAANGALPVSGTALWLDGSDPSSFTLSSGIVTAWHDRSGNGRSVTPLITTYALPSGLQLGGGFSGTEQSTAAIGEVLIYPRALTLAERSSTEAYLAAKWAVPGPSATASMASGPSVWLDAANASSVTITSGQVSIWLDSSGNGVDFTASGAGVIYSPTALNGQPAIVTDGASVLSNSSIGSPTAMTILVVARQMGAKSGRIISGVNNNWLLGWWQGRMDQAYYQGWVSSPATPSDTSAHLYSTIVGTSPLVGTWNGGLSINGGGFGVGARTGVDTINGLGALTTSGQPLAIGSLGTVSDGTTAFVVARQKGTASQRILGGVGNNWLLGWWQGRENQA